MSDSVLEKVVLAALGSRSLLSTAVRAELERLSEGGYLDPSELERLSQDALAALEGRLADARQTVEPVLGSVLGGGLFGGEVVGGLARQVREALDIPSRSEVLALTEALREARRAGASGAESGAAAAAGESE